VLISMGHSMGGKVAMLLACRHPERVHGPHGSRYCSAGYDWVGHRASFAAMNELSLADLRSRAEAELRFEARVPSWPLRKFLATNSERSEEGVWRWQINLPVLTAAIPVLEGNPLSADDTFAGPVRFIREGDRPTLRWATMR
jgi:pimeloyl-ACP methyl ester carboxylesterase